MFMGQYSHSIDEKGRLIVPAKLRDGLGMHFVVTKGLDHCLYAYPSDQWEGIAAKIINLPPTRETRLFERNFIGSAREMELDKQGRVLIPQDLRDYAGIDRDAVLVGVMNRVEIWGREQFDAMNCDADMEEMAEHMADMGLML